MLRLRGPIKSFTRALGVIVLVLALLLLREIETSNMRPFSYSSAYHMFLCTTSKAEPGTAIPTIFWESSKLWMAAVCFRASFRFQPLLGCPVPGGDMNKSEFLQVYLVYAGLEVLEISSLRLWLRCASSATKPRT